MIEWVSSMPESVFAVIILVGSLLFILGAAELFTNGIEWVGFRYKLGHGAVGSVLAAVGTALPETIVPMVAIFGLGAAGGGHRIGIGAILGAPFMLSTLALFAAGMAVIFFRKRRPTGGDLFKTSVDVDSTVIRRDLVFFLKSYAIAVLLGVGGYYFGSGSGALHTVFHGVRYAASLVLIFLYVLYVKHTLSDSSSGKVEKPKPLYVAPGAITPRLRFVFLQVLLALAGIIIGAKFFVAKVEWLAHTWNLEPLVLSLLIIPIATELPEKFNSVIWLREAKDTLALGNITGAMVFQSTFPVSVGLLFTDWSFSPASYAFVSVVVAALSSALLILAIRRAKTVTLPSLLFGGALYMAFLILVVFKVLPA